MLHYHLHKTPIVEPILNQSDQIHTSIFKFIYISTLPGMFSVKISLMTLPSKIVYAFFIFPL